MALVSGFFYLSMPIEIVRKVAQRCKSNKLRPWETTLKQKRNLTCEQLGEAVASIVQNKLKKQSTFSRETEEDIYNSLFHVDFDECEEILDLEEYKEKTTYDIQGKEVFAAGTWKKDKYSEKDLDDMVDAFNKLDFKPALKMHHEHNDENAKVSNLNPALGYVTNLYRKGKTLFADFSGIPKKVFEAIKNKAYNRVSSEIAWNFKRGDKTYRRVLCAVSLLGADIPAVANLETLNGLYSYSEDDELHSYDIDEDLVKEDSNMKTDDFAAQMKTEGGVKFPASAFAYVPDPQKPSTWKLRLWESPEKKETVRQVGLAVAAFSPGGFRGNKVSIPSADMGKVKGKVRAAWSRVNKGKSAKDMPKHIKASEDIHPSLEGFYCDGEYIISDYSLEYYTGLWWNPSGENQRIGYWNGVKGNFGVTLDDNKEFYIDAVFDIDNKGEEEKVMPDKELKEQLEALEKKLSESQQKIKDLEAQKDVELEEKVKKEFAEKEETFSKEKEQLEIKLKEFEDKQKESEEKKKEFEEKIKTLSEKNEEYAQEKLEAEKARKEIEIKAFIDDNKAKGKILPRFESYIKSLLSIEDTEKICKFSVKEGDKEIEKEFSISDAVKELVKTLPDMQHLKELSIQEEETNGSFDIGDKVDKAVKAYAAEHKINYSQAWDAVLKENPKLKQEYLEARQ